MTRNDWKTMAMNLQREVNRLSAALAAAVPAKLREPTPSMISAGLFALWGAPIPSRNGMEVQDALTDTGRIEVPRDEWWEIVAMVLRAGLRAESAAVPAGPEERETIFETALRSIALQRCQAPPGEKPCSDERGWCDRCLAVNALTKARGSVPGGSPTRERG